MWWLIRSGENNKDMKMQALLKGKCTHNRILSAFYLNLKGALNITLHYHYTI